MIDYGAVIERFRIKPRGVLHIGAFDGAEDPRYVALGFAHRLYVEAQPDTYAALAKNLENSGAFCENLAVSDRNGQADFYAASFSQSSSLLRLDKHLDIYPGIVDKAVHRVETIRIDDLLAKDAYSGLDFNFMNVDIQGAEMLAMSGATVSLQKFDLLNLEVNFDNLYKGVAHVTKLDAFLSAFDFVRADTQLFHATWGDAIYVRNRFTKVDPS